MTYAPTTFVKGSASTVATSAVQAAQLLWAGWLPSGSAPAFPDAFDTALAEHISDPASQARTALRATLGLVHKVPEPTGSIPADTAAIQATVDACADSGGGIVFFPAGLYTVNATITLPVGVFIHLLGSGMGTVGDYFGTRLKRGAGMTNPILAATGTSTDPADRPRFHVADMEFHGGDNTGDVLRLTRIADSVLERVRIAHAAGTLLHATEWFNCALHRVFFQNGGTGRATPAVLLDSPATGTGAASGNTIHFTACEWEANTGLDLRITGNSVGHPSGQDWTLAALFSNIKMERNTGDYPLIDLDRAGACQFSDGFFHLGPAATAAHVEQKGTAVQPGRANGFTNCEFSASTWTGSAVGNAAALPYFLDVTAGQLLLSNVSMNGSPSTAFVHVGAGVGLNDVRLSNVAVTDRSKLLHDERPGSLYGFGSIPLVPVIAGVAPISSVNRAVWILPDAATTTLTMANVPLPADLANGRPLRIRLHWYSDVNAGAVRWNVGLKLLDASGEDITAGQADVFTTATVPATANRTTTTTLTTAATDLSPGTTFASVYVARLGADAADTATGGGRLLAAEILYERAL